MDANTTVNFIALFLIAIATYFAFKLGYRLSVRLFERLGNYLFSFIPKSNDPVAEAQAEEAIQRATERFNRPETQSKIRISILVLLFLFIYGMRIYYDLGNSLEVLSIDHPNGPNIMISLAIVAAGLQQTLVATYVRDDPQTSSQQPTKKTKAVFFAVTVFTIALGWLLPIPSF